MNKNCYRVIFSRVLQRRVVVAESARIAHGQASAATESPATTTNATGAFCGLMQALRAGLRLALGLLLVVDTAQADIVADASAPATQRPTVLNTANGLPQVNIQTPSAAGVSRNSYSQFDVGAQGAILNNSRVDVQTQLGGWVTANPWLARGPARVILNEVNSASPSLLQGYIEVAGQRAQVVVANPAGISCNGCGFINASRSTLTTGSPVLNNGNLEAFVVQRGTIRIEGLGMDATRSDYSDVIARAVQLNAGLWTPRLNIVTGAAQVEVATGDAAPAVLGLATAAGAAPRYAVDVSALGGMYAGKIHLVGTEAGVGVVNAGDIGASVGDVVIAVDGQLSNSGRINAGGSLNITTQQGVDNSGTLYARQDLAVNAAGDISNSQVMAAGHGVTLASGGRVASGSGSLLAAGLDENGQLGTAGTLTVQAAQGLSLQGQTLAAAALDLQAPDIDLSGSQTQAPDIRLSATGNLNLDQATVLASQQLTATAGQTLQTTDATVASGQLLLAAHDLDNRGGHLSQTGTGSLQLSLPGNFINSGGWFGSNSGDLQLSVASLLNDGGEIVHAGTGTMTLQAGTLLDNHQGLLQSNAQTVSLQAPVVDNRMGLLSHAGNGSLQISADTLQAAQGSMDSAGQLLVQVAGSADLGQAKTTAAAIGLSAATLQHAGGVMQSAGVLLIDVDGPLGNAAGQITGDGDVLLRSGDFSNSAGLLSAGQNLLLWAQAVDNSGQGKVLANRDVTVLATSLNNQQGILGSATAAASVTAASGPLNNVEGRLQAATALAVVAPGLDNTAGLLSSAGTLSLDTQGQTLTNTQSGNDKGLVAAGALTLNTGDWNNDSGFVGAGGNLTASSSAISNRQGGLVSSQQGITLSASALDNTGGSIQSQGSQSLMLGSGVIANSGSLLYAGATLAITAGTLLNSNTQGDALGLQGNALSLQLDALDNSQGALRAIDSLGVTSHGSINNSGGLISSQGDLLLQDSDLGQPALQMINTDGTVIADRSLTLDMASLSGDGQLLSPGRIAINLDSDFTNTRLVQAGSDLQLGSKGLVSNQGQLLSAGSLALQAARVDNSASAEINAATLRLEASDTLTNRGLIDGGDVRLTVGNTLSNIGTGRIYGDHLALQAGALLNTDEVVNGVTTAAVIAARDRLDIGVATLTNEHDALIFSGGAMAIGGTLDSAGLAVGQAVEVNNIGSLIEATGALSLAASTLNNRNANFQTEMVPVGTPQSLFSLDPADDGNNNQYDISNFERYSWSRTYKYRWKTASAEPVAAPEPGKTPLPQVGETEDCAADPCALLPTADYAADNAAWSYFQLTPPAPEPAPPVMAEPLAPTLPETDPDYAAAWQTYQDDKAVYDTAWADYNATHASWQTATDASYAALDDKIEAYNAQFSSSGNFNKWTEFHLTQTETETHVLSSDPARLLSGGDMTLRGDHLVNDKSQIIAGGLMYGDLGSLDNIQAEGVHVVHQEGTSQYTDTKWRGGLKQYYQRRWYTAAPYQPADQVSTITLPVTTLQASTTPVGSGTTLAANVLSVQPAGAGGLAVSGPRQAVAGVIQEVPLSGPLLPGQVAAVIRTVDIDITLPDNALFLTQPAASSHVLVETDPRFANYRQWLSSDYLLNALSFDPARTQKRLGDGFYEQKLVREQIAQLTGLRFLEGYASDEEQYRALMDNAVTFAQAYGLRPGLALTPAQMAALTSDIVWLVEETVTLPDGSQQKVLAPRVYVKTRIGDLKGDGTLIAAQDMDIRLQGSLANSGTMAGRQVMKITADTIRNLGGRIDAGTLSLAARNDLDNQGGLLTAKDSAYVTAGHDLTMASTTQTTANTVGDSSFSRTALDRLAGLYVSNPGGTLTLAAGHDLTLTAAQVVNAGSGGSTLSAGHDLRLNAVNTAYENNAQAGASYSAQDGASRDIGTTLVSGRGGLQLSAGHDLGAVAAAATTTGALRLDAGNDLVISSGHATSHQATASNSGHGDQSQQSASRDVLGSSLIGSSVALTARQGDLTLKGSQVAAQAGDVSLAAGKGIALLADEAGRDSSSHMHSGDHGKTLNREESSHSRTQVAAQISATGNATLTAEGGDLTLAASGVKAGGNIAANAAGDINVISGVNHQDYSLETAKKGQTKFSNHQEGYVQETLAEAGFVAGGDLKLEGKGDVNLAGAQLQSGGLLQIGDATIKRDEQGNALHDDKGRLIVERGTVHDINDTAVLLHDQTWNETQSGYTGPIKTLVDAAMWGMSELNNLFAAGQLKMPVVTTGESSQQRTDSQTAVTSTMQGQDVLLSAQNAISLQGSSLLATGTPDENGDYPGGNIAIFGKDVDLSVAQSRGTESQSSGKSTTQSLGLALGHGELRMNGLQKTDQEITDSSTTTHYQGVQATARNILVQSDNAISLTAAKLSADKTQGTLALLGDKVWIGGIQDSVSTTHTDETETQTVAVAVRNAVMDAALAIQALADGVKAEADAVHALNDARQRVQEGSLAAAALKDYELNLAAVTASLAQLKIALGMAAATAAATTSTGGFYVSGSAKEESTVTTQNTTSGIWQGSELSGHQLVLKADDLLVKGSRITADTAQIDAGKITLAAGESTQSHSESTQQKTAGVTVSVSPGAVSGGVSTGRSQSEGRGSATSMVNSQLSFGHLDSTSDVLTLDGGTIEADTANLRTKTLTIADQQNTASSQSRSSGYTAGVSVGNGGITGVNGSLSRGSGSSESATVSSPSGIIVHDGANSSIKANMTDMTGGIIANATRDVEGRLVDQGQLQADLGVLTTHELNNYNHSDQRGFSVGGSMGLSASGTATPGSGSPPHGTPGSSEAATDPARGTLTISATHGGHSTEGITRSTIGQGTVTATTIDGSDALAPVNRDLNTSSLTTEDQDTHGLDATATVDARWATSAGRKELLAQEKQSDALLAITGLAAGAAITSVATGELDQTGTAIGKVVNAGAIAETDPRLAKTVKQVDDGQLSNTPELSQRVDTALSPDNEMAGERVKLTDNLTDERGNPVMGAASTYTNTLYVNANGTGPLVDVLAHESMHLSGAGEVLSGATGWLANAAFGVGGWTQSTAISQASIYNFAPLTAAESAANYQVAIIEQINGQLDYWGSVGHQSAMAAMMYAGGLSATKAKLMGEAAWAPDTDSRNAMSLTSLITALSSSGSQQNEHVLDGKEDYVKDQVDGIANVKAIVAAIKDMSDEEAEKYLSQPDIQLKLHKAGDAFAHVDRKLDANGYLVPKGHYPPFFGHMMDSLSGSDPDSPHENSDMFKKMMMALFKGAADITEKPRIDEDDVEVLADKVIGSKPPQFLGFSYNKEENTEKQNVILHDAFPEAVPEKPAQEYGFLGANRLMSWIKSWFNSD